MEKEFDFDKIGKRMPYQTPDGFFDEMEANIWNEVKGNQAHKMGHLQKRVDVIY